MGNATHELTLWPRVVGSSGRDRRMCVIRLQGLSMLLAAMLAACAPYELAMTLQPPRFHGEPDLESRIVLLPPAQNRPLGGAALRVWTRVENPNAVGLTIAALDGTLFLDGVRAATASFPLGLPLPAQRDTIIPLDFAVSFADLPGLVDVAGRIALGRPIGYRMDGTIAVDAGMLGRPTFGPMTLVQGDAVVRPF
jgi:hypothetical protein